MMVVDNRVEPAVQSMSPNNSLAGSRNGKASQDDQVLARETFEGYVLEVTEEEVLVQYDTGDDLVEQCYGKDQFQPGKIPAAGDRIAVDVVVRALAPLKESASAGGYNEYRRKNVVRGNLRF
jgi:hypothetical protein